MAEFSSTRGGLKKLMKALREGKTVYSIEECAQSWGDEFMYREWRFTSTRLGGFKCGHMGPGAVLSGYGPLYDEKPRNMKGLFDRPKQMADPFSQSAYADHMKAWDEMTSSARRRAGAR